MATFSSEFSHRTRKASLQRFRDEIFDVLVIGGGITGAAVARDAATRGLKVALVERKDFAYGTSSRSSKLIHGGLRYLQNMEFGLVFEALAERALLLRTAPHMVRPLPFFLPVYEGDSNGRAILDVGLWLYDLLALFRTPGFHQRLSKKEILEKIPELRQEGLKGGFSYFDASMWDDVLAVETIRSAHAFGAAIASYTEAVGPLWAGDRMTGFRVRDLEDSQGAEINLRAHRVIVCAGPWTDLVGATLSTQWRNWLNPSKGVHLLFDLKKLPMPGAMVMSDPDDGRIAFIIPRPDFGNGVVIVGTTDGPTPKIPDQAEIEPGDVAYLMALLARYFPAVKLSTSDILSGYVGVRPLMGATVPTIGSEGQAAGSPAKALQKVSREHYIGMGPGGSVVVAGGKYTTHRKMGEEIVDFTLKAWRKDVKESKETNIPSFPTGLRSSQTKMPVNPKATFQAVELCRTEASAQSVRVPEKLLDRYGAEAIAVMEANVQASGVGAGEVSKQMGDPEGFPMLAAQLRHSMRSELVMHLEDFYLRRIPLYSSRADHGLPWLEQLSWVWAEERGVGETERLAEIERLRVELAHRSAWKTALVKVSENADHR